MVNKKLVKNLLYGLMLAVIKKKDLINVTTPFDELSTLFKKI